VRDGALHPGLAGTLRLLSRLAALPEAEAETAIAALPRVLCERCGTERALVGVVGENECYTCAQEQKRRESAIRQLRQTNVPPALLRWPGAGALPSCKALGGASVAEWQVRYCELDAPFLTLLGETDAGKTTLATKLLVDAMATAGRPGVWASAMDLAGWAIQDKARFEHAKRVPWLLVDEVGRGHNGSLWDFVHGALVARGHAGLPSIVTSNRDISEEARKKKGTAEASIEAEAPPLARRLLQGAVVRLNRRWWDKQNTLFERSDT
jgi:hypothetical protein